MKPNHNEVLFINTFFNRLIIHVIIPALIFRTASRGTYHMSICVEYSDDPSRTSGGRYQRVTTSLE